MSLKQEIDINVAALKAYDAGEYDVALRTFQEIADSSKIYFNMGMIHATLGEHKKAIQMFVEATKLDQYLAIAYFQEGVSNFLLGEFDEALGNFNDALLYLRGNLYINYEQLGLKFKLYSCEVLFNRGLSYIYLGDMEQGMQDLSYALKEKQTDEHAVIEEAIRDKAEGYTVFSVPVGVIYRPSDAKIKNAQKKDYLGQAKLIAATDAKDGFTGFTGAEIKKSQEPRSPSISPTSTTFATHQMVKTDIKSSKSMRGRAQSDAGPESPESVRRDKYQRPFPVKAAGPDRGFGPKTLPPTPPSESESYSLQRSRSRSQPASGRTSTRSSGSSDYAPPPRPRLDTVRDEDDYSVGGAEMRRARSMGGRGRSGEQRQLVRSQSRRELDSRGRRGYDEEGESIYDVYDDYYEEKPVRSLTTRRPLARGPSRSRNGSVSRGRSRDDEDEFSRHSDGEDDEFEIVTPRRAEISKIKVKVKMAGTAKIVMIPIDIDIKEFIDRVAAKFAVTTRRLKCTFREEDGTMMDLSDQDELETLIELAKEDAKLNRREFGRAEVICTA